MVLHSFHLFAGAGGGILADILLGHIPIGAIEINQYCRETLLARQTDLILPRFPIWDDVNTFRSDNPACALFIERLVGMSEELIISGGFPCQDISVAGKGSGITGERSGLWKEMFRIIREVRPRFAFVENVPALVSRGLDTVLGDLASIGYDAEWCVLGADDCGAPHHRKRIWILAYSQGERTRDERENIRTKCGEINTFNNAGRDSGGNDRQKYRKIVSDSEGEGFQKSVEERREKRFPESQLHSWWETEPGMGRVVDGMAYRVDRIRALGNGQVPIVAATAWSILMNRLNEKGE